MTLNRQCASGLEAAVYGAKDILAGEADLVLTGGVESMSTVPYHVRGMRWGVKMGPQFLIDGMAELYDDVTAGGMWIWAENMAERFEVSRQAQDEWSLLSHQRAVAATASGRMRQEIAPIELPDKKGVRLMDRDEGPRADTSLEKLARLEARFKWDGTITPGNASPMNDGGAAVVIASREYARKNGLAPMARVVGYAQAAVEPKYLFAAPAYAIPKLLKKIGWTLNDVDLIELNEAFAAQVLADGYALADQGWNWDKVNVHGGAIALGHPLGCSGARIVTTLVHEMKKRGSRYGLATMCVGVGQGEAVIVEMIN